MTASKATTSLILLVLLISLSGLVLHEAGHGLTALAFGEQIISLHMFPGFQLYPVLKWEGWNLNLASIGFTLPDSDWQNGLILLMGAGTTALVGILALVLLALQRVQGAFRRLLLFSALLLPLDMIAYTVFPALGLRHWIFIGGLYAEPLLGAQLLGFTPTTFYLVLLAASLLFYGVGFTVFTRKL